MAGEQMPDVVAAPHYRALRQVGFDGFVARHQATRMRDRQHRPVHHHPGEVDAAIRRCPDDSLIGRGDVDAPVSRAVGAFRGNERTLYRMGNGHRPSPAGGCPRRGVRYRRHGGDRCRQERTQDHQATKPGRPGGRERGQHLHSLRRGEGRGARHQRISGKNSARSGGEDGSGRTSPGVTIGEAPRLGGVTTRAHCIFGCGTPPPVSTHSDGSGGRVPGTRIGRRPAAIAN